MKNTAKDLFDSMATITPAEIEATAKQVMAERSPERECPTVTANKLYWATRAIRHAIDTMTPEPGRREYNRHTVACRNNLTNTLAVIELSWSEETARITADAIRGLD